MFFLDQRRLICWQIWFDYFLLFGFKRNSKQLYYSNWCLKRRNVDFLRSRINFHGEVLNFSSDVWPHWPRRLRDSAADPAFMCVTQRAMRMKVMKMTNHVVMWPLQVHAGVTDGGSVFVIVRNNRFRLVVHSSCRFWDSLASVCR